MWHAGPVLQTRVAPPVRPAPRRPVIDISRHGAACNNARLPGDRLPLRIGTARVGFVRPEMAEALTRFEGVAREGGSVVIADAARGRLPEIGRALAEAGHFRWRGEAFDVRAAEGLPPLGTIDRGALPALGLLSVGVHLNGLVRRGQEWLVWLGRRAPDKAVEPNKLDNVVAGGVPAGLSPWRTLLKEAAEEATLPSALLARAREAARIGYAMDRRSEGLRRDRLICYDVTLPESFQPVPADGEMSSFDLWPIARAEEAVRETDDVKFNVNLVLMDLFRRLRLRSA